MNFSAHESMAFFSVVIVEDGGFGFNNADTYPFMSGGVGSAVNKPASLVVGELDNDFSGSPSLESHAGTESTVERNKDWGGKWNSIQRSQYGSEPIDDCDPNAERIIMSCLIRHFMNWSNSMELAGISKRSNALLSFAYKSQSVLRS